MARYWHEMAWHAAEMAWRANEVRNVTWMAWHEMDGTWQHDTLHGVQLRWHGVLMIWYGTVRHEMACDGMACNLDGVRFHEVVWHAAETA